MVKATRYGCAHPHCGAEATGVYPEGMEPEWVFGRRLEALVIYLHEVHDLSYGRLQRLLVVLTGLEISVGRWLTLSSARPSGWNPRLKRFVRIFAVVSWLSLMKPGRG
jgi:hypothetical protein